MTNFVKVGSDVGVGAAAGVIDQLAQNWDNKREEESGEKLTVFKQAGTYVNYGVPLAALALTVFGMDNEWTSRALIAGSTMAGRKATYQMTKQSSAVTFRKFKRLPSGARGTPTPSLAGLEF